MSKICAVFIICLILILSVNNAVVASENYKRSTSRETLIFFVMDGGVSSITVETDYREYYRIVNNKIEYYKREKIYRCKKIWATVKLKLSIMLYTFSSHTLVPMPLAA